MGIWQFIRPKDLNSMEQLKKKFPKSHKVSQKCYILREKKNEISLNCSICLIQTMRDGIYADVFKLCIFSFCIYKPNNRLLRCINGENGVFGDRVKLCTNSLENKWLSRLKVVIACIQANGRKMLLNKEISFFSKKANSKLIAGGILPGLHPMSALPTKPGSHVHTIVRSGNESTTEQTAFDPHGRVSMHGFLHTLLKQAILLGQSASTVHCGFSSICTRTQRAYASPTKPGRHLHVAMWLSTRHWASGAHVHGSWHRSLVQARWKGQS